MPVSTFICVKSRRELLANRSFAFDASVSIPQMRQIFCSIFCSQPQANCISINCECKQSICPTPTNIVNHSPRRVNRLLSYHNTGSKIKLLIVGIPTIPQLRVCIYFVALPLFVNFNCLNLLLTARIGASQRSACG